MENNYLWAVEVTTPPKGTNNWRMPARYFVVAKDMEEAIQITKQKYPEVIFIKVIRDKFVDDVLIQER